jgi:hypothetical protein
MIGLEANIDLLVYKLYELSYEEVIIIISKFAMTRDEFEHYIFR